jgi:hypothetical protein
MLHRVLPSKSKDRMCLTVWFSSSDPSEKSSTQTVSAALHQHRIPPMPIPPSPRAADAVTFHDQVMAYLLHPRHRMHVARLHYAHEWQTSIYESHHDSPERRQLLEAHARDTDRLKVRFFIT